MYCSQKFLILYLCFTILLRSTPVNFAEKTYLKKCSELLKAIDEIEEALYKVASNSDYYEVAIGFGTALSSLKQIFTINSASNENQRKFPNKSRFQTFVCRQLGIVIIQNLDWLKEISQCRVFVLVKTTRPEVDIGIIPCNQFKLHENKHTLNIDVNFEHSGFDEEKIVGSEILQETSSTLSSNLDKLVNGTRNFVTDDSDKKENITITENPSLGDKKEDQNSLSWYKISTSLKGFKI